ncbi:hypothetical protein ADUPG1_003081, partial [Aduncisulcus paluster]
HGVNGDQQRTKCDTGILWPNCAKHDKAKRGNKQTRGKQPRGVKQYFNREGRNRETDKRENQSFDSSHKAVITFR